MTDPGSKEDHPGAFSRAVFEMGKMPPRGVEAIEPKGSLGASG